MNSPSLLAELGKVLIGLVFLTAGAEALVRGAGTLARRAGVSALLVGLTVVAFGTSAPEVAVSVGAGLAGRGDVALGNVVGSNIFNVLFILGASALITPLMVRRQLVRLDVPIMVGVSALPFVLGFNGRLGRAEGIFLLSILFLYLLNVARLAFQGRARGTALDVSDEASPLPRWPWPVDLLLAAGGLAALALGAEALVDGASSVARAAGMSELVIGLTLVAAGTSLPEVATSVVASLRGERDLAVGNVVGSNIFNVLAVLGVASVVTPGGLPVAAGVRTFDFPVMLAVAAVCLPIFVTGARISRTEGAVLLIYYALYLVYLGLHVTDHDFQEEFGMVVLGVVLPLTIAMGGALWMQARDEPKSPPGEGTATPRPEAEGSSRASDGG